MDRFSKATLLPLLMDMADSSSDSNSTSSEEELDLLEEIAVTHIMHCLTKQKTISQNNPKEHLYAPVDFRQQFRVNQNLVTNLVSSFRQSEFGLPDSNFQLELKGLSHQQQLLCFLFYIGHKDTMSEVSTRFGIHLDTFRKVISVVVQFLNSLMDHAIKWPKEQNDVQNGFKQKAFQGVLGCLDVIYISFNDLSSNSEETDTISLQGICDHKHRFTNIFVETMGYVRPSVILKASPIYAKLSELCSDGYILASGAYPPSMFVLTPYLDDGQLTEWQRQYNDKHRETLSTIWQTFAMLKRRFPCLYHLKSDDPALCKSILEACCILHNLADREDLVEFESGIDDCSKTVTVQIAEDDNAEDTTAGWAFRKGIAMQMYKFPQ